jgi:hypothetical protein
MPTNVYLTNNTTNVGADFIPAMSFDQYTTITASGIIAEAHIKTGIHPVLMFKYIKKKFNVLERVIIDRRLAKLEKAFYNAVDNGQEMLGKKLIEEIAREQRETLLYASGVRTFIEKEDLDKLKHKIRDGHISDTLLRNYTRVIPNNVIAKKKKLEHVFDDFVIYHYYNKEVEAKLEKKQKMSSEEISKMRDPILFGIIKETNRLYFIADWEDEYCDLTFDEIIGVVADGQISKTPVINL